MGANPVRRIGEITMSIASIVSAKTEVISVAPDTGVSAVVALLHDNRIGAVLVIDGTAICGIVSERDIVGELHRRGAVVLDLTAREIMTTPVVTVAADASITAAMATMTMQRIRHLPVVTNGALVGLVSIGDLVKRRIEQVEQEANALKDYIAL